MSLDTKESLKIYPSDQEKTSFIDFFINSANAGAGPFEYFPVDWSKNDKKIIVEWTNTTGAGSGGVPTYKSYTIDVNGGDLVGLATSKAIFTNDNLEVVYVYESDNSPSFCGPSSRKNNGSIILKNIETGEQSIVLDEKNSEYSLVELSDDYDLTYKTQKVIALENNCSQTDKSTPEFEKNIKIK